MLRNGTYPISVSSERIFQAIAIINYAKEIGAAYVAHGSTKRGNDQVRFDLTFQILAPEIKILTPTRDMTLTREYEISYLKEHGYEADFQKMEYSINKGLGEQVSVVRKRSNLNKRCPKALTRASGENG